MQLLSVVVVSCALFALATADWRDDGLKLHNEYRKEHGAPPLKLSKELNNVAQNWANEMKRSKGMQHSGGKYGENLYMTSNTSVSNSEAVLAAVKSWYDENKKYNYRIGAFTSSTGHFTQVVWKDSKYLGLGISRKEKAVYVVAEYDPRGNVKKKFLQNVLDTLL